MAKVDDDPEQKTSRPLKARPAFIFRWLACVIVMTTSLAACISDSSPTPTLTPSMTATATSTSTPAPTSIPVPTALSINIATPDASDLLPAARAACDLAMTAPIQSGQPEEPILVMDRQPSSRRSTSSASPVPASSPSIARQATPFAPAETDGFFLSGIDPLFDFQSAADVRTIVCIHKELELLGFYELTGEPGFRHVWDARLVRWPEGTVVRAKRFVGGDPPEERLVGSMPSPITGDSPSAALLEWVVAELKSPRLRYWEGDISSMTLSSDGALLAVAGDRAPAEIVIWDMGVPSKRLSLPEANFVHAMAFSPDGRYLAVSETSMAEGEKLTIWDVTTSQQHLSLGVPLQGWVAFSPDGGTVAIGGGEIRVWNVATGQELSQLGPFNIEIGEFPRIEPGTPPAPRAAYRGSMSSIGIRYEPDGRRLALFLNPGKGEIAVWDISAQQQIDVVDIQQYLQQPWPWPYLADARLSADGSTLAVLASNGTVVVMDTTSWQVIHILSSPSTVKVQPPKTIGYRVQLSHDGRVLLQADQYGTFVVWDLQAGRSLLMYKEFADGLRITLSPSGRFVAVGSRNGTVRLLEIPERR